MTQLGKYDIIQEIGKGGFGNVYKARDLSLEREVALKVLHPQLTVDQRFIENFHREARNLARIHHPNVVAIYEIGEEDGRLFIAMQCLPGGSLADRLERGGPLKLPEALEIVNMVSAGLEAGHKQGIIHRDIKPGNILFDEEGQAVIADFGVARAVQLSSLGTSTQSSGTVGTPFYRPPELWRGSPPPSPATDVYSLACVLYEMLTGEVLFTGDTPDQLITKHLLEDARTLMESGQDTIPADVKTVIEKALAKEPSQRYQSTKSLFEAIKQAQVPQEQVTHDGRDVENHIKDNNQVEEQIATLDIEAERDDQKPLSLQPEGEIRTQPNVSLEQVNLQVDMQQVETGERLLAEDQLDQAVEKLEEAYKIVPEQAAGAYARALFTRGAQRERTGSQEGALQDYHRALEVAPEDELKDEIEISISEIESISTTSSPKTRKLFVWVIGIIVVGIIVVFSISGIFTNQFPPVPTQIIEESEQPSDKIIINAADGWTNTGIVIHQGDLLTVQYLLGLWSPWPGGDFDANGDLNSSITDPANINMRCLHGELIGRIGTKQSFCVGTDYSKTMYSDGVLYFSINDNAVQDNSGSITVRIEVNEQQPKTAAKETTKVISTSAKTDPTSTPQKTATYIPTSESITPDEISVTLLTEKIVHFSNRVTDVSISPADDYLATASDDGIVKLWDSTTLSSVNVLYGHTDYVRSIVFSHDGQNLGSGSADKTVRIWSIPDGKAISIINNFDGAVDSLVFSPDDSLLAMGADNSSEIKILHMSDQSESYVQIGSIFDAESMGFSPDGKILAFGGNDGLKLWNTSNWSLKSNLSNSSISDLVFSKDGQYLINNDKTENNINIWDAKEFALLKNIPCSSSVGKIAINPQGTIIAAGGGEWGFPMIWLYDFTSGKLLYTIDIAGSVPLEDGGVTRRIIFNTKGDQLIVAFHDYRIRVWDLSYPGVR